MKARDKQIAIRLTSEEYAKIQKAAKRENDISVAAFVRQAALKMAEGHAGYDPA